MSSGLCCANGVSGPCEGLGSVSCSGGGGAFFNRTRLICGVGSG